MTIILFAELCPQLDHVPLSRRIPASGVRHTTQTPRNMVVVLAAAE